MAKFLFVVGGVYSGCGKGITTASLAKLILMRGIRVNLIKCDPYLNVNAGTMSPRQHGEVFLCDDGTEADEDLGHYERITGLTMCRKNILTNGTLNKEIAEAEERGDYLGETVQIVPHVTDKIQNKLLEVGDGFDLVIAEIGGTVGDYESAGMYEAIAQFKYSHPDDVMIGMVAPIITNRVVKEMKTKPLQNAVRELRSTGLQPDMLLCRCDEAVSDALLDKISRLTNVPRSSVFFAPTVDTIYKVPMEFFERGVDGLIVDRFRMPRNGVRIQKYRNLVERYCNGSHNPLVTVGIVGKYENCDEAYVSLKEALIHAAVDNEARVQIKWINAETLEGAADLRGVRHHFENVHGVIVPGGFDVRGVEGKVKAVHYCREKKIPFLGICLGLQCAVIEFARNVANMAGATSQEFDGGCAVPVIHFTEGQHSNIKKSATMRRGAYDCELEKDSVVRDLYKKKVISERHRHRYEVNPQFVEAYAARGFVVSGRNPQTGLVEMMELRRDLHPFFVGTQAHPEFRSRLGDSAPLFDGLIKAALALLNSQNAET